MQYTLNVTSIAEQMLEKLSNYSVQGDISPEYIKKERYKIVGWMMEQVIECIRLDDATTALEV